MNSRNNDNPYEPPQTSNETPHSLSEVNPSRGGDSNQLLTSHLKSLSLELLVANLLTSVIASIVAFQEGTFSGAMAFLLFGGALNGIVGLISLGVACFA